MMNEPVPRPRRFARPIVLLPNGFTLLNLFFGIFAIVVGILSIVLALRVRDFGTQIGAVT